MNGRNGATLVFALALCPTQAEAALSSAQLASARIAEALLRDDCQESATALSTLSGRAHGDRIALFEVGCECGATSLIEFFHAPEEIR